ncbi:ATP synthase subunit b [Spirochaetia bacterium]|nr:ATP synthase subunit b [Spirochaetia bacterium]
MLDFSITFFITLLNIAILFIVMRKILFKPVTKFMENRTAKIRSEIENAEKDREEAKSLRILYEGKLKAAEAETAEKTRKILDAAEKRAAGIITAAKAQAESLAAAGRKQITNERQAAMITFRAEAAALVVAAAGRLLRQKLDSDDNRFAEQLLRELGNKN